MQLSQISAIHEAHKQNFLNEIQIVEDFSGTTQYCCRKSCSAARLTIGFRMTSMLNWIDLTKRGDARGSLIAIESQATIPFEIKRVYYIFDTLRDVSRGYHAHRDLKQLMICTSGRCRITLDDGNSRVDAVLDNPQQGLFIDGLLWREMHDFTPDCVLLVLASEPYRERDYIRDYQQFIELSKIPN